MAKTPRMDRYTRTIARLYEALLLLKQLGGKTQGPRYTSHGSYDPASKRRAFLQNLAYVCDFRKGGESTVALAVEETDRCYKYWVTTNGGDSAQIVGFLEEVLGMLEKASRVSEDERALIEEELQYKCLGFAQERLKKEVGMFLNYTDKCLASIKTQDTDDDAQLASWIRQFKDWPRDDHVKLCKNAHDAIHSPLLDKIKQRERGISHHQPSDFEFLRHRLGRLAAHIRAVQHLVSLAVHLQLPILSCFELHRVPPTEAARPPEADNLTTLSGILKRMLDSNDEARRSELERCLILLDKSQNIEAGIRSKLNDPRFKTQVHAEVQVLDHFHTLKLRFLNADRFVACSKPACWCCSLYFRHHPARPVQPESNGNMFEKWGVTALPQASHDARWPEQRKILVSIIHSIRDEALEKIQMIPSARLCFPDSVSGITRSDYGSAQSYSDSGDEASDAASVGLSATLSSVSIDDLCPTPTASASSSCCQTDYQDHNPITDSSQGIKLAQDYY